MRWMDHRQALEVFGRMRSAAIRRLWEAARPVPATALRPGLYLGRNAGMGALPTWIARHVVGRDWFAKLVLDGWGVNVRVLQDGTWTLRPSRHTDAGPKVDLPFRLGEAGLDYGFHLLGADLRRGLSLRDFLRAIAIAELSQHADEAHLAHVGARRDEDHAEGELLLGYMAPLGLRALSGTPFAMSWDHAPTPDEVATAEHHVHRRRFFDTSSAPAAPALGR